MNEKERTFSMDEAGDWHGGESIAINRKKVKNKKKKGKKMARAQNSNVRGGMCCASSHGYGEERNK